MEIKRNWSKEDIYKLYDTPLMDLVFQAAGVHRQMNDPNEIQVSTLLSIKTGNCSEDCGYCPQSARYSTGIENNDLMSVRVVEALAKKAQKEGSSRLCMGAAWRNVRDGEEFDQVVEMVEKVNELGMEVCCTLGMITENQAKRLANAGLYAYNHNIDSSEEYYKKVISTRGYEDRLNTIENVRKTGVTVCSGGIIGMGETKKDRCDMLYTLSLLNPQPESVPINALVAVEGTPLEEQQPVVWHELVRMVATARMILPNSVIRLSAGRTEMSQEAQTLCFMAGASSIFAGEKLLTTPNPERSDDQVLFDILDIRPKAPVKKQKESHEIENMQEKPKWSRPGHVIDRNVKAAEKGKLNRIQETVEAPTLEDNKA
ncbi:biotin synthase BioB [bacterium SCSIO 12741]|nr:biotin synthase BioB [bacterium SCSIO 12741]